jgi:Fe-S-cluster containining protein
LKRLKIWINVAALADGMNRSMVCATTPTARIAPTFGMTDAMNGKEGRMTLFNKLAGKASAMLNASGICSNNCIDGHCSGCGECCADLLPLTKGEIKRLRDYARKHHLQENKRSFLETKGGPDLSCPFRNEHTKQCDVYSVRPLICKEYICSRLLQKPIAQTGLTKEKRDIHSLRWEVFKNPECENLLKEAQKSAMKRM